MIQDLPFERFSLENGLNVILHQDRELPLVAVNLWYFVGSKDEPAGRSGFAHLFEHLMFMGTERVPGSTFDGLMEQGGGANNASTSRDRTNYYASGPSNLLPTLLWLEADRLESLGTCMTQEKLDLQRDVVRNERRQSYENRPYGRTWLVMPRLTYPPGHPYHMPVIGSHEDLVEATVADVQEFFATWYVPRNASLVIAGDFERDAAVGMVQDLFGDIPGGEPAPHRNAPPVHAERPVEQVLQDRVPAPRTHLAWHSPAQYRPGDAEMDLLAGILADGAASRLEQALIHKRALAEDVSAYQQSGRLGSTLHVAATALPGVDLQSIERVITEELERLLATGPTEDELTRVVASLEGAFVRSLESLLERADLLNAWFDGFGEPGAVRRDLGRYLAATPQGVWEEARRVLDPAGRAVLRILPEDVGLQRPSFSLSRDERPDQGSPPPWKPPLPAVQASGDRELWCLPRRTVPLVNLQVLVGGGVVGDPPGRSGQESLFAELLTEAAGARDAAALDAALDHLGAELMAAVRRTSLAVKLSVPSRHLEAALEILGDVLLRAPLAERDFRRLKQVRLAALEQRRTRPEQIASLAAARALFGEGHPWGNPFAGYSETLEAVQHEHLQESHRVFSRALGSARVVAAGDLDPERLLQTLPGLLGEGAASDAVQELPGFPDPAPLRTFFVAREQAPQTVIRFLSRALPLTAPETPALWLANAIFGGSFTSRLNMNLREKHGFTYGAGSAFIQGARIGTFTASTSVKAETTGRALAEMLGEFARLQDGGVEQQELERALATQRTQGVRAFAEIAGATAMYAHLAASRLPPATVPDIYAALEDIGRDQVGDVAGRFISAERGVLVLVGEQEHCRAACAEAGLGDPVELDEEGAPAPR